MFEIQSMSRQGRVSEWSVQRSDYTECRPRSRGLGHWWQLPPPPPDTPEPAPEELGERERSHPPAEICQFLSSKGCFATSWVGLLAPAGADGKVRVKEAGEY